VSTADELRARAVVLRAKSEEASAEHARLAREMVATERAHEHAALQLEAGVADCMSRRYAQWAARLDEAAYELENP
jgi:hypothetical protein